MGERYTFSTIEECVFMCIQLPEDKREMFLSELVATIRFSALSLQLFAELGTVIRQPSMDWIDDGVRHITGRIESPKPNNE